MKKHLVFMITAAMLLLPVACDANTPAVWQKNFGGSDDEYGYSVQQTADGGYIVAGMTGSFGNGNGDVYLLKIDGKGNEQWYKTFGGEKTDWANSVRQTADGGYIIAGATESYGNGESDVYLVKTDKSGNEVWSQTFGGQSYDDASTVRQTSDGGYIVLGTRAEIINERGKINPDIYLLKVDAGGNEIWSRTFGGQYRDAAGSIEQTTDGGYIIVGTIGMTSYGDSGRDVYLIKVDAGGDEVWSKRFGSNKRDDGTDVWPTADGGYIIVGLTDTPPYGTAWLDIYMIKTDGEGNDLWTRSFGGTEFTEYAAAVRQTDDGGYIILGSTGNEASVANDMSETGADVWLIKTDGDGNKLWTQSYGGSNNRDEGTALEITNDGGYIIAGSTFSIPSKRADIYVIKTDAAGNTHSWPEKME